MGRRSLNLWAARKVPKGNFLKERVEWGKDLRCKKESFDGESLEVAKGNGAEEEKEDGRTASCLEAELSAE